MNRKLLRSKLLMQCILVWALCCISIYAACALPSGDEVLRVGLIQQFKGVKQVTVIALPGFTIISTKSKDKLATSAGSITLEAGESEIILKRDNGASAGVGDSVMVVPDDSCDAITIDSFGKSSKQYRGSIEVNFKSRALQLVNVVKLEDYLLGVLPMEVSDSYPQEALRAQAIAARTYALDNERKHSAGGFDLCDSDDCQVYAGVLAEKARCTKAVSDTAGVVLTFNNQIASVQYSADCGGMTQNYLELYPNCKTPYLCGVTEPCEIEHECWEKSYKLDDLGNLFLQAGINEAAGLKTVAVSKIATSGRALLVDIVGATGKQTISGDRLRKILSVKSTFFDIQLSADGAVIFRGKGYGHGVGLCQVGAKCLAGAPYNYTYNQILTHYFPGTVVSQLSTSTIPNASFVASKMGNGPAEKKQKTKPNARVKQSSTAKNDAQLMFRVRVKAPQL